jgi:hypothetical protein
MTIRADRNPLIESTAYGAMTKAAEYASDKVRILPVLRGHGPRRVGQAGIKKLMEWSFHKPGDVEYRFDRYFVRYFQRARFTGSNS